MFCFLQQSVGPQTLSLSQMFDMEKNGFDSHIRYIDETDVSITGLSCQILNVYLVASFHINTMLSSFNPTPVHVRNLSVPEQAEMTLAWFQNLKIKHIWNKLVYPSPYHTKCITCMLSFRLGYIVLKIVWKVYLGLNPLLRQLLFVFEEIGQHLSKTVLRCVVESVHHNTAHVSAAWLRSREGHEKCCFFCWKWCNVIY